MIVVAKPLKVETQAAFMENNYVVKTLPAEGFQSGIPRKCAATANEVLTVPT